MNPYTLLAGAFCMLLAVSCRSHSQKQTAQAVQVENIAARFGVMDTAMVPGDENRGEDQAPPIKLQNDKDWDKKIVKTGTLNIEAGNYIQYDKSMRQAVRQWGGYIAAEKENATDDRKENVVTIKVPVQYFGDAMQQLSASKGKVIGKEITTEDVTGEFVDTRARMEAKKQVRLRYVDILQKAKNVAEVLAVEKEINAMQEEIEAAAGRVNYLQHSAAYSTIELTYYQILNIDAPPGYLQRIWSALSEGGKGASEFLIALLTLWPLWILGLLISWIIRKAMTMRNRAKISAAK